MFVFGILRDDTIHRGFSLRRSLPVEAGFEISMALKKGCIYDFSSLQDDNFSVYLNIVSQKKM